MAYVTVPKDLTRVKSKIVFGLTKRQLICFGGALLVGVPLYFLLRGRVTGSAAALIMVVVGIYAVLIQEIGTAEDISGAIWGCMGYTVLLCFCLFKTGSISKSVFSAH